LAPLEGIPGPVGEVFGVFEPRFYGVTLILDTERAYSKWARELKINPNAPEYQLTPFEQVCLDTCDIHEVRHFHDSLISPFASLQFLHRIKGAWYGLGMLRHARALGANCIPTPLSEWVLKSEAERAGCIAEAQTYVPSFAFKPPPLPFFTNANDMMKAPALKEYPLGDQETDCRTAASAALYFYKTADEALNYMPDPPLSARCIFEMSALAVQISAIDKKEFKAGYKAFIDHLLHSSMDYAQVWRLLLRILAVSSKSPEEAQFRLSAIAVWCLLADISEGAIFSPDLRLTRLLKQLVDTGWTAWSDNVASMWDDWDKQIGAFGWRNALSRMQDITDSQIRDFLDRNERSASKIAEHYGQDTFHFGELYLQYKRDQIDAVNFLLDDPNAYVDPAQYQSSVFKLPMPVTAYDFGALRIPAKGVLDSEQGLSTRHFSEGDKVTGWSRILIDHAPNPRPGLLKMLTAVESRARWCEAVLFSGLLRPFDLTVSYIELERLGLKPLFVF